MNEKAEKDTHNRERLWDKNRIVEKRTIIGTQSRALISYIRVSFSAYYFHLTLSGIIYVYISSPAIVSIYVQFADLNVAKQQLRTIS